MTLLLKRTNLHIEYDFWEYYDYHIWFYKQKKAVCHTWGQGDCCAYPYLEFEQELEKFPKTGIITEFRVYLYGIVFVINGQSFWIAGYDSNNGYYSTEFEINYQTRTGKMKSTADKENIEFDYDTEHPSKYEKIYETDNGDRAKYLQNIRNLLAKGKRKK